MAARLCPLASFGWKVIHYRRPPRAVLIMIMRAASTNREIRAKNTSTAAVEGRPVRREDGRWASLGAQRILSMPHTAKYEAHALQLLTFRHSSPVRPAAGGRAGIQSTPNGEHQVSVLESETDPTHVQALA